MKRTLTLVLACLVSLTAALCVSAADLTASVFVTVADNTGTLVLAQESITVTDIDSDGTLTVHDALYCAHEAKFEGGAEAGYRTETGDYGLSLTGLWGCLNGTGFGYYVNNASAMSLTDPVKEGDSVSAFVYTDTVTWSDTFCFFDQNTVTVQAGESVTLTLSAAGFDANFSPVTTPVSGAVILLNGDKTAYTTDGDGKVTIPAEAVGSVTVSAVSDSVRLVPPVCKLTVEAASAPAIAPETGDSGWIPVLLCGIGAVGLTVVIQMKKKALE